MVEPPTVVYNAEMGIWKSENYPHSQYIAQTLGEAFLKNMRAIDPARILEHHYDSETSKSAGEIYRDAVTVARNLQRLGVRKTDVVVFYSMNNSKISVLAFGCWLIGAVVNFFDTTFSEEHIDYTLQLLEPNVILFEEVYGGDLLPALKRIDLKTVRHLLSIDGTSLESTVMSELFRPITAAEITQFQAVDLGDPKKALALLGMTSGSTGMPKAIALSHSIMLHGAKTWWWDPQERAMPDQDSVILSFSPLRWIGAVIIMLQSVLFGFKRVFVTGYPDGLYGRKIIWKNRVTHFSTTPRPFHDMLRTVADGDMDALSSLRFAQLAGEPTSKTIIEMTNQLAPKCWVLHCYGMTELSGPITNDGGLNGGTLLPGLEVKVVDEQLAPVGPNVSGMLLLKTPTPFIGYIRCDNSKYYFEDGFFLTGDYGFVDEQCKLHWEARYKDLVRTKEITILPSNIEKLVSKLPEVAASRLVGYRKSPNESYDTGALFVILQANVNKASEELIRQQIFDTLGTQLTKQELENIPDLHFVETFPRLSCGKIDQISLRSQAIKLIC